MTRSPNYGRRTRPPYARALYVVGLRRFADGSLAVALEGERQPMVWLPARDDTSAITQVELVKRGAWSLPVNPMEARCQP
jgi:hypothetical protein